MIFLGRYTGLIGFILFGFCAGSITGCGKPGMVGVYPEYPPVVRKVFSLFPDFVKVDTLMPTFRWQPLTIAPIDQSTQQETGRIENITYEIRIWRTVSTDTDKLVYARDQLTATEHRLEKPLEPGTQYLWSVRAHFEIDGRNRMTEWTMVGYLLRNEPVPNDSCLRFRTPLKEG